mmetsp:Transcript_92812/g.199050  ORF Transcript_92812/g.199050 Transcript_92812/m.199050 type:complete len:871 (-) Transcript_92812:18-2630(-)
MIGGAGAVVHHEVHQHHEHAEGAEVQHTETGRPDNRVELGVYLKWIKNQMDDELSCLELPFTIILLISFSCLAVLHLKQDQVYTVEGAMRFDIEENANFAWSHNFGHKTVFDVNSIADFWSWFRIGFLPLIVQHSFAYSEALQDGYDLVNASSPFDAGQLPSQWSLGAYGSNSQTLPVRDDYLHYNRMIGGIRLRQERAELSWDSCRMPGNVPEDLWKAWLGKPCMPALPTYELHPEVSDAEAFLLPAKRVEWLMTARDDLATMQKMLVDMEDGCAHLDKKNHTGACSCTACMESGVGLPYVDEQTQRVEIGFIVFNAEYGLFSLVTVNFFFNRGGMIHKFVHVQSSWSNHFAGPFLSVSFMLMCDLTWILSLTWVLVSEVKEIMKVVRSSKERWYTSIWREYVAFWNCVDWISIICAYVLVFLWLSLYLETRNVNTEFEQVMDLNTSALTRNDHISVVEKFFNSVEAMCAQERSYRMSFMTYPYVVMLRLFKSFHAQPRLAVVTNTLITASQDMLHFFIVFFSVYFCMAVNSVLLFGQDVESFATLDRAIITCFRAMFGDWDWTRMKEVGLLSASLWFWIFLIVIVVLLLNMLLAILMDAYSEVKSHTENAQTLPIQISEMVRRRRQFLLGARVRLNDIWNAFFLDIGDEKEMVQSKEKITPERVQQRVKEQIGLQVPFDQAKRTLKNAKTTLEQLSAVPYTIDTVKDQMQDLDKRSRLIRDEVVEIARTIGEYDTDEAWMQEEHAVGDMSDPRVQITGAVKDVVGQLKGQIEGVLLHESQLFEERQAQLQADQSEMLICAQDTYGKLQELRKRTERMARTLQQSLQLQQRQATLGAQANAIDSASGVLAALAPLTACGSVETGQRRAP